ncbi:MAG: hypothetical protein AUK34_04455 [Ignavibacteria bacterium CG2_30_36_16]|nr:MAG: hypothetical protein AUK34_04455 [Ignavibacteria bacterium CG2_30_36_16]PJB01672.1 MAG: hypothetical protein CO127_02550 [Ignavibacteria bacterium CG_4_9_14_3_um_filter_36_18]
MQASGLSRLAPALRNEVKEGLNPSIDPVRWLTDYGDTGLYLSAVYPVFFSGPGINPCNIMLHFT